MSPLVLPLEIMGQGLAAVGRKVINRTRQSTSFAGVEVIHTANKARAFVGAVVPYNLIGCWPPLKPGALLPVPGCCFSDLGPLVMVFEIDNTNFGTVGWLNRTVVKI